MSSNFPFVVYNSPDGWSVVTATTIVCHNTDEVTAKELTAKALDLPAALINEAFANSADILAWRATFHQATVAMLAELNASVSDLDDATAEDIAELRESVELLNDITAEQDYQREVADLRRELANLEQRFDAAVERSVKMVTRASHGPNMQRQNRAMVIAATWDTPLGERIKQLREELE